MTADVEGLRLESPPVRRLSGITSAVRGAGPMAFAAIAANGSNVVVTVIIARLLSTRGYGSLVELIAVFIALTMPGSALLVAVVRRVSIWALSGDQESVAAWVREIRRRGMVALAIWSVAAIIVRSWLGSQLGLPGPAGVAEVLIAGGAWALVSVERGLIQSRRAYTALARNLCVEAAARTVVTLVLVGVGLGVEGAALGLVAAMAAAIIEARRSLGRIGDGSAGEDPVLVGAPAISLEIGLDDRLEHRLEAAVDGGDATGPPMTAEATGDEGPDDRALEDRTVDGGSSRLVTAGASTPVGRRHLTADLLTALASLGLLAGLQNVDVLIVGRRSGANSGPYGAISVACKAVVYGAIVLAGYLLPEAVARYHQGQHALRQLAVALVLVALPAVTLASVAAVAPTALLKLAFGPDKAQGAPAFATLAVAMGALSATVLLTHYLLAIGQRSIVAVLALGLVLLVVALTAAGGGLVATARAELACQAGLAAVTALFVLAVPRSGGGHPVACETGSTGA
jgi:O-antigen/teichoic acid export membrane protein